MTKILPSTQLFVHPLLAAGLIATIPHLGFAQTSTWDGGSATSDDWTDGDNWGGGAPLADDLLQFDGANRLTPVNDFTANTSFSGIQFLAGANPFTLGGNAIDLSGDIDSDALGIQTVDMDIALTNDIGINISNADSSSRITFNGGISGSHGLNISGTEEFGNNRVTFNGANTYTGLTTVGTGGPVTLWATDPSALPGDISVSDGSTLRLRPVAGTTFANNISIAGAGAESLGQPSWMGQTFAGALVLNDNADVSGTVTLTGDSVISGGRDDVSTSGLSGSISGQITGNFDLQFGYNGGRPGQIRISNTSNDWSGDTVVVGGGRTNSSSRIFTLHLDDDNVLPFGAGKGDLTISENNARVDTNGNVVNINGLNSNGSTVRLLGGGDLTLGHNDANGDFTGELKVDSLTKVGSGNQQLGGDIAIADTNVDAGTITLTNGTFNATNSVTVTGGQLVMDGGELEYTGSTALSGSVTLNSGSIGGTNWEGGLSGITVGPNIIVSPGNSPGQANTMDQTWADGGTYEFEINDAEGALGTSWDHIAISGELDVSGLTTDGFTLALVGLLSGDPAVLPNFDETSDYSWEIASFSTIVGTYTSDLINVDTSGFLEPFTGTFAVNQSGNSLVLDYTAVPEPSTFALLFAGCIGALVMFRRRK